MSADSLATNVTWEKALATRNSVILLSVLVVHIYRVFYQYISALDRHIISIEILSFSTFEIYHQPF